MSNIPKQHQERIERQNANMPEPMAAVMGNDWLTRRKHARKNTGRQAEIFTAGQELPIFTQSAYGTAPAPFVEREEVKQAVMFPVTFDELAEAEQKKKSHKHFMAVNWWLKDKE